MLVEFPPVRIPLPQRRVTADHLREALLDLSRGKAAILSHAVKRWASATFTGARHRLELLFDGTEAVEAGELFIACLPEHEFDILGQLVADAAVTEVDHRFEPPRMTVRCELLLLEEA